MAKANQMTTNALSFFLFCGKMCLCRHNLVVKCVLPKHNSRVRFPLPAPNFMKTVYSSPIGKIMIESDGKSLKKLYFLSDNMDSAAQSDEDEVLKKTKTWLDAYFAGKQPLLDFDIDPSGTPFQKAVWKCLCDIPYGETTTYGEIAKRVAHLLGKEKMGARAVGRAVGSNPISIIIPCHRVLGANGALTGYAWGLERKIKLLDLEKANKELP